MLEDGLASVFRATGSVAASRRQKGAASLVHADHQHAYSLSHRSRIFVRACLRSATISMKSASAASGRAPTTMSNSRSGGSAHSRTAAASLLLTRFLLAIDPTLRETANPTLPSPGKAISRQNFACTRFPVLKTSSNLALVSPVLMGQSRAAPQASALDHVASVVRSHSDAETVGLTLVPVVRLIRALHGKSSSNRRCERGLYPQRRRSGKSVILDLRLGRFGHRPWRKLEGRVGFRWRRGRRSGSGSDSDSSAPFAD